MSQPQPWVQVFRIATGTPDQVYSNCSGLLSEPTLTCNGELVVIVPVYQPLRTPLPTSVSLYPPMMYVTILNHDKVISQCHFWISATMTNIFDTIYSIDHCEQNHMIFIYFTFITPLCNERDFSSTYHPRYRAYDHLACSKPSIIGFLLVFLSL